MTRWPGATQLISQRFGTFGESAARRRSRTLLDLCTDDNVLEDLVQGMAGVKAAVGVGRAIVEEEGIVNRAVGGLPLVEVIGAFLNVLFVLGGKRARPVPFDVSIRTDRMFSMGVLTEESTWAVSAWKTSSLTCLTPHVGVERQPTNQRPQNAEEVASGSRLSQTSHPM